MGADAALLEASLAVEVLGDPRVADRVGLLGPLGVQREADPQTAGAEHQGNHGGQPDRAEVADAVLRGPLGRVGLLSRPVHRGDATASPRRPDRLAGHARAGALLRTHACSHATLPRSCAFSYSGATAIW